MLDSLAGTPLAHKIMTHYPVLHYALPVARAVNWPPSCTAVGFKFKFKLGGVLLALMSIELRPQINRAEPPCSGKCERHKVFVQRSNGNGLLIAEAEVMVSTRHHDAPMSKESAVATVN